MPRTSPGTAYVVPHRNLGASRGFYRVRWSCTPLVPLLLLSLALPARAGEATLDLRSWGAHRAGLVATEEALVWGRLAVAGGERWTGEAALNTGPVGYSWSSLNTGYLERGFLETLAGGYRGRHVAATLGWQWLRLADGRLLEAPLPALRLTGTWGIWRPELFAGLVPTFDALLPRRPDTLLAGGRLQWTPSWASLELGFVFHRETEGRLAELVNPFWPIVALRSPACRDRREACFTAMAAADGFLTASTTHLGTPWFTAEGYLETWQWRLGGFLQRGEAVVTGFDGRSLRIEIGAASAYAGLTWIGELLEFELRGLWASGDDAFLRPPVAHPILLGTVWSDTLLFFGGGVASELATGSLTVPGRFGLGVRAGIAELRWYPSWGEATLTVAGLWADEPFPSGARRYGYELDGRLRWSLDERWSLLGEGGWLTGGDVPTLTDAFRLGPSERAWSVLVGFAYTGSWSW